MNLLVYVKPIIQYANAILLTIKEMAKALALVKEQTDDIDYETEFAGFGDSVSDTTDLVNELNEAMGTLLGFDTLNILGDTTSTSAMSGLSVEGSILEALEEYNINLDKVNFKAKDISESMLVWLGYTKQLNEETGEYNWILSDGYTNLDKVKTTIVSIITALSVAKIGTSLKSASGVIKGIGGLLGGISASTLAIVGAIALIVAGFVSVYNSSEEFRTSIDNSLSNIKTNLSTIWNWLSQELYPKIKPALEWIWNIIKEIGANVVNNFLKAIETITELLTGDFSGAWQTILNWVNVVDNSISRVFGEDNWNNFKNTISDVFTSIGDWFGSVVEWFENSFNSIGNWFQNSWFGDIGNWFKEAFSEVKRVFDEYIVPLFTGIGEEISGVFNSIGEKISGVLTDIKNLFSNLWNDKIKPILDFVGEEIENVVTPIFNGIKEIGSNAWDGLKDGFKAFINFFIDGMNKIIQGLNKISFDFPEWVPGVGGKTFGINIPEIPKLAKGGIIEQPTMALMGEYANAKSNPEIVTPESLMRKVFVESMLPIAQAIVSGNTEVVGAIEDLASRPIELNGRKVSENIYSDLQKVALRKGQNLNFAK